MTDIKLSREARSVSKSSTANIGLGRTCRKLAYAPTMSGADTQLPRQGRHAFVDMIIIFRLVLTRPLPLQRKQRDRLGHVIQRAHLLPAQTCAHPQLDGLYS